MKVTVKAAELVTALPGALMDKAFGKAGEKGTAGVILSSKLRSSSLRNLLLPEVFFVKSRLKILPIIKSRLKILRKNFNDIAQKPFKSFKLANNA